MREDFFWGDEIDKYLLDMGVPQEVLNRDDAQQDHLTLEGSCYLGDDHYTFGETEVCGNQGGDGIFITDWLEELTCDEFMGFWNDEDEKKKIASLLRCPGGMHEWLMVSSLPLIKEMGIPISYVKIYTTPTTECKFYFKDRNGEEGIGQHGGIGSGTMHNYLYACILAAYNNSSEGKIKKNLRALKHMLAKFAQKFYPDGCGIDIPESLHNLIYES